MADTLSNIFKTRYIAIVLRKTVTPVLLFDSIGANHTKIQSKPKSNQVTITCFERLETRHVPST